MMSRKDILNIMSKQEIEDRLKNPLQYKFESLIEFHSNPEEKHKGSSDIIKMHNSALKKLNDMQNDIEGMWQEIFDGEPTDKEIEQFEKFVL